MALSTKLMMRQGQSLVMTPQLLQAIKLLQLSNLELAAFVEEELERNPLLERVDDRRGQVEALDPLRRPVGGDLLAAHPPDLFGVGLEEDAEQAAAKLVAHPVFE